ncbi:MAG: hypothetical protein M3Q85_04225, partial [Acidobacteriota bacterium]|nr:hypothetical protein [Acidobacteriota bacterium]
MHGTRETPGSPPPEESRHGYRRTGMIRALRRTMQVVAIIGTLLVGALALALIVSQTPWFKDWLRRYVVRESKQYVNGDLTIGGLGGNLLFGVDLTDVAVDVSGERVVAVRALELDYSIYQLITRGLVLSQITIDQPVLRVRRDAQGWNLAGLVKRESKEADREGPGRPISLPAIVITDGAMSIDDRTANPAVILPRRIDDLDVRVAFEYEPVHYTLTVEHIGFRGTSPALTVGSLSGTLSLRDDNLYVEKMSIKTAESSLKIDGVIEQYLSTPAVNVTSTGNVSLPEIGRIVPVAAGYDLHPAIDIKAKGPAQKLALNLDVQSEAGKIKGQVLADVQAPDLGVRGDVDVENLNLATLLKDPAQKSDLTGHAKLDVVMKSTPAGAPAADRLAGTFSFAGPRVVAAGYEARNVQVSGKLDGPRITIDGRAGAYGGTATA